jgi:hypothetical protein
VLPSGTIRKHDCKLVWDIRSTGASFSACTAASTFPPDGSEIRIAFGILPVALPSPKLESCCVQPVRPVAVDVVDCVVAKDSPHRAPGRPRLLPGLLVRFWCGVATAPGVLASRSARRRVRWTRSSRSPSSIVRNRWWRFRQDRRLGGFGVDGSGTEREWRCQWDHCR